jgi:hypothetical protein
MKRQKRGDAKFIYLIIIISIITILVVIFGPNFTSTEENQKNTWEKAQETSESYNNLPENSDPHQSPGASSSSSSSSGGSSSSSSSSGSGGGESSEQTCKTRLLRYSIITTGQTETCNEYNEEYCINKTVFCSAIIKNDDADYGEFEIGLVFVPEKKSKETDGFNRQTTRYLLASQEEVIMSGTAQINSIEEDGLANQRINCFFNTLNDMIQEVCS